MSKNIEDYLHLYLGCGMYNKGLADHLHAKGIPYTPQKLRTVGSDGLFWVGSEEDSREMATTQFKLILRPLSDMTSEEAIEIAKIHGYDIPKDEGVREEVIGIYDCKEGETLTLGAYLPVKKYYDGLLWLLKNSFDLFGLIESGLAINKSKTNQPAQ